MKRFGKQDTNEVLLTGQSVCMAKNSPTVLTDGEEGRNGKEVEERNGVSQVGLMH